MANRTIGRITLLLDTLATQPLWRLSDLAAAVDLPAPTCSRLLAELQETGWVDQVSPRGAYRLGPRVQMLAERQPYVHELVSRLQPVLDALVQELQQPVVVVRMRVWKRQLLLLRSPDDFASEHLATTDEALYTSATGRLLVAHLSARQRQHLVDAVGLPQEQWPGVCTWQELLDECRQIRRRGWAQCEDSDWHTRAVYIADAQSEGAAIGTYARPGQLHAESLAALQRVQQLLAI